MQLSPQQIQEFQDLWYKEYKEKISEKDAYEQAIRVLILVGEVYGLTPYHQFNYDSNNTRQSTP